MNAADGLRKMSLKPRASARGFLFRCWSMKNECLLEGCCRKSIAGRDIALVQSFGEPALPLCKSHELFAKGDQYVFVGMAGTQKAIISYRVGKRDSENTTPSSRTYASAALRFWNVAEIGLLRV